MDEARFALPTRHVRGARVEVRGSPGTQGVRGLTQHRKLAGLDVLCGNWIWSWVFHHTIVDDRHDRKCWNTCLEFGFGCRPVVEWKVGARKERLLPGNFVSQSALPLPPRLEALVRKHSAATPVSSGLPTAFAPPNSCLDAFSTS